MAHLRVTEGILSPGGSPGGAGPMRVDVPKMRAIAKDLTAAHASIRFTYRGPTSQQMPLASGEQRRQLGLKLKAEDGCNLLYVMWRIAPKPGIVVSVKSNPGQHASVQCGNRGYRNLRPARSRPVPGLEVGSSHRLEARLDASTLLVWVDDVLVWEGRLGPEVLALRGPVGVRTDNVRLELEMFAPPEEAPSAGGPRTSPR
ncbi:hypothetical protein [Vulgatibacter incomptus]|nr:hypothetical protein [Vulgatibacter incomptus]